MKSRILAAVAVAFVVSASSALAQNTWSDDFESYADTAALSPTYTQLYPTYPMLLDTAKGDDSSQSVHFGITTANSQARAYFNMPGGPVAATDAKPITISFMADIDTAIWSTREYIELRSYSGGSYGSGTLNQLIALGFTSSGVDTTRINQRVLYGFTGTSWGNLTANNATRATMAAAADWTKLSMVVKSTTVDFYVNDIFDTTQTRTASSYMFDSIVIGSGLSSGGADVWFDNLTISGIPEPSTFALGLLGGLGMLWISRRRKV